MVVINASEPLIEEDKELLRLTADKKRLVILNKTDLPRQVSDEDLAEWAQPEDIIGTSVLTNSGLDQLEERIADMFFNEGIESNQNNVMVTNARHIGLLKQAENALDDVLHGIEAGMPVDLVQIDMTRCWSYLVKSPGIVIKMSC